jgi:uncharacterized protein (DUF2249 family)
MSYDAQHAPPGERGSLTYHGGIRVSVQGPRLVMDIRALTPALRRPLIMTTVDHLLSMGATETVVVICDSEPAGLGYQMELRRETRGRVSYSYDQRLDGAWVALITLLAEK